MVVGVLVLVAVILIVIVFAGAEVSAFINDTLGAIGATTRESETKIPNPQEGQIVCDVFIIADWQVRLSTEIFDINPIIFFDPAKVTGGKVGIDIVYQTPCKISSGITFSFLPLFDFLSTRDQVQPLEFIFPIQSAFDEKYKLSWILVQADTGRERKLVHYQEIEYVVPSFEFDFRFQQKLVFRDIVPDDYILKIVPLGAKFADLDDGQAFLEFIPDPTQ